MCGLVGIAGNLEHQDELTMKRLFILDYLRGPDSTGFAAVRKNGDIKVAKAAVNPIDFFDMDKFKQALSGYQSRVFIGHNRLATKGKINGANAHPFEYEHIVGAHNGTLDQVAWNKLEELTGEKFDVDSQALICAIAKLGIEETIKNISGAWALTWYDSKEKSLNFLRNDKRPFWYAYTKDFKKMIWASEWPMIRASVDLSTTKYEMFQDKEGYCYFPTAVDTHYKFDMEELGKGGTERPKPVAKIIKGKEAVSYTSCGSNVSPFQGKKTTSHGTTGKEITVHGTTGTSGSSASSDTVRHLVGNKGRPLGGYMTEQEFLKLAQYGCSWCGTDVEFTEQGVTIFEHEEAVMCPKCSDQQDGHSHIFVDPLVLSHPIGATK